MAWIVVVVVVRCPLVTQLKIGLLQSITTALQKYTNITHRQPNEFPVNEHPENKINHESSVTGDKKKTNAPKNPKS